MKDIPVILICYNRPWHTAQVLKALLEHNVQNLYIFSDAPKNSRDAGGVLKTRELFKAVRWTKPKIIERDENYGLARSIVSAVNHVFEEHDRLILLEDDCVPRKYFFDFMKECLERYEHNSRVFGINGYTVPIAEDLLSDYPFDIYFYPRIGSWGWATWKRAWMHYGPDLRKLYEQVKASGIDINQGGTDIPQNVQKLINGELKDVWTLNWVLSVYLNKGYYVYPTFSQIRNIGFDGTGLHCGETHKFDNFCVDYKPKRFPDDIIMNEGLINNYNDYFGNPNKEPKVVSRQRVQHSFIGETRRAKNNSGTINTNKLSIVHINTHDEAGGAAKVAWRLAEAQRNAGYDSIMLVGEKRSDSKYSFSFPVEANRSLRIQCRQQGQLYYEFQGSHKLVNNQHVLSADILHLHNLHGDFFNPFSLSALSHLKPIVWTLHDQQPTTGHCAYSLDCRRWENGCSPCPMLSLYPDILVDTSAQLSRDKKLIYDNSYLSIVVPSQWLKDNVQRSILRNHPVELIYNGIDTNIFRPYDKLKARKKFGIPADVLIIGAVAHGGALENPWKGGNYTRAVFDALQTKLPDHIFVNIGGDSRFDNSRIISIPHINDESELAQAYSMLDIFLYTPAADNCPLVVLEALSCGIPIVTFDTGGVPELVRDGLDGYVSPYKDVHGLVQALEKLATQTRLRAEFGRNARQEAIARFDHKKTAQQYQKLYERCLQQRKGKAIRAKLLPTASLPRVILSDAFVKAEDSKKAKSATVGGKKKETSRQLNTKVVPIVFFHYGDSECLKYSLSQARLSNPRSDIILFGDDSNNKYNFITHKNISDYFTEASEFANIYKHLSPNPGGYELFCIQRWFVLKEFMKNEGVQACFHLDSDVLLYADITQEWEEYRQYDLTLTYAMAGHNSFVNSLSALEQLCHLIASFYSDPQLFNYLKSLYTSRMEAEKYSCGISDMVFLNEYQKKHPDKVGEMLSLIENSTYDLNINLPCGFEMSDGFKKIYWIDDKPFCRKTDSGSFVKLNTLHFQGKAKSKIVEFVRTDKALEMFLSALRKDGGDRTVVLDFGSALECLGEKKQAVELYSSYLQNNPEDKRIENKLLELEGNRISGYKKNDSILSAKNRLTIATSISPKSLAKQVKTIESWVKVGFDVVSINCAEEIQKLQEAFPDVKFVLAKRDAREMFGKPVVYFDDFLEYFSQTGSGICGIVNSDIFLFGDEGIISFIKEHAKDSFVYGSRIDVDSLEVLEGDVYEDGFDFFFFDKSLISCFPKSDFCVGMPWWDYWVPLIPALEKIQLKRLVSGFAYHLKHLRRWDEEHYNLLAKRIFGHLHRRIDEDFYSTADSNPGILLAEMLLAYWRQDIMKKNRKEGDELSIGIISPCIIDFLKLRSSEIYYSSSELADKQNALVLSQNKEDIFVHKTEPEIQVADSLRAEYEVSIVLCTKGRAELLDQMLASLKEAARRVTYEVIVVEGGSSDDTLDVLRKHKVRKVYSEPEWLGPGRHSWPKLYNFGFSKANGRWAMYASDDIVFSMGCISEAVLLLNKQSSDVAGGVFFYRNVYPTNPEWSKYGIDFTSGQKLLMNYGLVRLDCFRKVGGLDEAYRFYCADTDFCYKLYKRGLHLIPLPSSFVAHDNVLDAQKKANYSASDIDIELMQQRWKHFVPTEIPDPRRLTWQEDLFEAFNLPINLGKVNSGIESFWHGLAYFQRGLFKKAESKFIQAIELQCDHWHVHWLLANAAYQCGDKALAEKMVLQVLNLAPAFEPAKDFLNRLGAEARKSAEPVRCRMESENRLSSEGVNMKKDIVGLIFSKDRAMQLQAALESFFLHCADSERIKLFVLYHVSNHLHQRQYNSLKENFSGISFIEEVNFKEQVLSIVGKSKYVLFLVDDNLFVKDFSLVDVVRNLRENRDAIGFSLRLGKNTNYCYSHDSKQSLPVFHKIGNEILKYNWTAGEYDFGYPLELSSSLYRTSDILILLDKLEFTHPNILEDMMAANAQLYAQTKDFLLCYENSVTFCNPINKVQSVWDNRSCTDDRYSAESLAEMFEDGVRIDIEKFSGFIPNSCHQEVQVCFKPADRVISEAQTAETAYEHKGEVLKPKFSIVMANYNNGKYIGQAIESVLNQTFTDWELIIVEDCSTDNSLNVIKRYLNDTRIKLIRHKENRGKSAALRAAIANVRSEYFGILDSDDCLLPHAVETMYEYHVKFPDCGLIYSQFTYCHQDLTQRCVGFCDKIPAGKTTLDENVVSHFQTFKLHDYLKTSGYDENILYAEDVDIVYKMEEVTSLKFVDECLYLYRELPDSICHSKSKINVAIMSRVKARINALKRRCDVLAESGGKNSDDLFAQAVKQARVTHKDVEQYFVVLAELYKNNLLLPDLSLPADVRRRDTEGRLLWLAANVNIQFDKLFESLAGQGQAEEQPLVTVYIVTYNSENFITRAIDSVLSQVYKNFELLIVDDGSTDKTKELVASYSDNRIRYIYKEHKNCASGVNRVIAEAKGKYIMVVDSDDFIAPDYIEKMVAFAEKHPQVDYFYPAQLTLVNESGDLTGQQWDYMDFSDNTVLPAFLFGNCYGPIPNPGTLKRKTLFDKVGLYDEVDAVEDFVFLCKNALKINFKRVDEHSTYFYRRHQQSTSLKFETRNRIMADVLNEMVSIYPAEVLYPRIADISDADLKEQQYYKYVVETFCRHANGPMVQFGQFFQKYAVYYKSKLLRITGPKQLVPK